MMLLRRRCVTTLGGVALIWSAACTGQDPQAPPPGADEPIFQAGVDLEMFYDDYESYNSAADLTNGNGKYTHFTGGAIDKVSFSTTNPKAGSKKMVIDFQAAGEYGPRMEPPSSAMENNAGIGPDVVIVTWWWRHVGNELWSKEWISNVSGRLLHHGSDSPPYPNVLKNCWYENTGSITSGNPLDPVNTPPRNARVPTWNRDDTSQPDGPIGWSYKQNIGWASWRREDVANDGNWHRYTTRFTRPNSTYGQGRLEMWADGIKVSEYIGDDPARCEFGRVYIPVGTKIVPNFHYTGPTAFNWAGGTNYELDDMRVWTTR